MSPNELKEQVRFALRPLLSTRLINIGRTHTIEWIIFSPEKFTVNEDTKEHPNIEYALHIQCTWRIRGEEGILVASDDLYFPVDDTSYHNLDEFDWTLQGSNRLDEITSQFLQRITNDIITVLSVEADNIGGLCIELSDGYSIDIFPANSLNGEFWRFFNRFSNEEHFVMTGKGIEE